MQSVIEINRVGNRSPSARDRRPQGVLRYPTDTSTTRRLAGWQPSVGRPDPSLVRVVIVDDHTLLRTGVRLFLKTDATIEVVGEATGGEGAIALVAELQPDVVVLDVIMPGMDGVATTAAILREQPSTAVIALTGTMDPTWVTGMIKAGAIGYLAKTTRPAELCRAIHGAAIGQVQFAPEAAEVLLNEMRAPTLPEPLTPRELDVLQCLVAGMANKGIARSLHIGEKTVKTHMSNIIAKLGVESRTQAALIAIELGILQTDETLLAS